MKPFSEIKGIVYNIQRYSVHDGPGIRTIIFFKGCPLRCLWCSNPESQKFEPEYMTDSVNGGNVLVGKEMSVDEVMHEALRDKVFYDGSGGGITLSGGEVLAQPDFAAAIIAAARDSGIHTVVSTCGYSSFENAWRVLENTDLILFDIKGINPYMHKNNTGVSNELIHNNLKLLIQKGKEVMVRVPLIPEHNANIEEIQAIFDFAENNGVSTVEILPYHRLGESKYERLSRKYFLEGIRTQSDEEIKKLLSQVSIPKSVKMIFG